MRFLSVLLLSFAFVAAGSSQVQAEADRPGDRAAIVARELMSPF